MDDMPQSTLSGGAEMDLRSQLDALDDTPTTTIAPKSTPDADTDALLQHLRDSGRVDQLKRATTNETDMAPIDATARSQAEAHQGMLDEWDKEVAHQQALLADPSISSQPVEILKANLAFAEKRRDEIRTARDKARALQVDNLSDFWQPFAQSFAPQPSEAKALQQYAESAGAESLASGAGGLADYVGGEVDVSGWKPLAMSDIGGMRDFGRYMEQTAGSAAGTLAHFATIGAATGGSGVIADLMAQGHGQMRQALEQAGVTDKASLAKGTYTYGTLIGGLQAVVPWAVMRGLTAPAQAAFVGSLAQISARVATGSLKMGLAQTLAMSLASVAQTYGVTDVTGKPIDWGAVGQKVLEEIPQNAISGTLFGAFGEAGKIAGGGYKVRSSAEQVQAFMEMAGIKPGTPAADDFMAAKTKFDAEQAAAAQAALPRLPAPQTGETAAGKPSGAGPAPEPTAAATAALREELGVLATERTPEADARRAELETQIADAEAKAAAKPPSPEEAGVRDELAQEDAALGEGEAFLTQTFDKLSDAERQEIIQRAHAGENAADVVEEVAIRSVQVEQYAADNNLTLDDAEKQGIAGRMVNNRSIEEATELYAEEEFLRELTSRQPGTEGAAAGRPAAAGGAAGAATGGTAESATATGSAANATARAESATGTVPAAAGEPGTAGTATATQPTAERGGTAAAASLEPGAVRSGGEPVAGLGQERTGPAGAPAAGEAGGAARASGGAVAAGTRSVAPTTQTATDIAFYDRQAEDVAKRLEEVQSDIRVKVKSAQLQQTQIGRLRAMQERIDNLRAGVDDRSPLKKFLDKTIGFAVNPQDVRDLRAERLEANRDSIMRSAVQTQHDYNRLAKQAETLISDLEDLRAKRDETLGLTAPKKMASPQIASGQARLAAPNAPASGKPAGEPAATQSQLLKAAAWHEPLQSLARAKDDAEKFAAKLSTEARPLVAQIGANVAQIRDRVRSNDMAGAEQLLRQTVDIATRATAADNRANIVTQWVRQAANGLPGFETAKPAPAITPAQRDQFRETLRGNTPRKQWAAELGVDAGTLDALIKEAEAQGLLRVDRNGIVRRTAKARTDEPNGKEVAAAAPVSTPSEEGGTPQGTQLVVARPGVPQVRNVADFSNAVDALKARLNIQTKPRRDVPPDDTMFALRGVRDLSDVVAEITRGSRLKAVADHVRSFKHDTQAIVDVAEQHVNIDVNQIPAADRERFLDSLSDMQQIIQDRLQLGYRLSDEIDTVQAKIYDAMEKVVDDVASVRDEAELVLDDMSEIVNDLDDVIALLEESGDTSAIDRAATEEEPMPPFEEMMAAAETRVAPYVVPDYTGEQSMLDVGGLEVARMRKIIDDVRAKIDQLRSAEIKGLTAAQLEDIQANAGDVSYPASIVKDWADKLETIMLEKRDEADAEFDRIKSDLVVPDIDRLEDLADGIDDRIYEVQSETDEPTPEEQMLAMRASPVTETPAFKRWFGDSKAVDENGKPLVVYHGTNVKFDAFDAGQIGTGFDASQFMGGVGFLGKGFYFGPSERKAADYGDNVVAAYLSLKRPLMLGKGAEFDQITDALKKIAGRDVFRSDATEILRTAGYDGIIKKDYHYPELDEYVAFDPTQIKSAIGNRGTFDPNNPDIAFALRGFYSPAIKAAEDIRQEKGTGEQFWKQITKVPGVKKDELDWMGLEDFLAGKKSITKAEVLDFMRANQAQLDERQFGGKPAEVTEETIASAAQAHKLGLELEDEDLADLDEAIAVKAKKATVLISKQKGTTFYTVHDPFSDRTLNATSRDQAKHMAYGLLQENVTDTRFGQFKVPGGENYRELLIRLPELGEKTRELTHEENADIAALQIRLDEARAAYRRAHVAGENTHDFSEEINFVARQIREIKQSAVTQPSYTSKHFQDQEIVHLRVDDRTGPNGEKVLFVNEVQSDLHQQGRRAGYKGSPDEAKLKSTVDDIVKATKGDFDAWSKASVAADSEASDSPKWRPLQQEAKRARDLATEKRDAMAREAGFDSFYALEQEADAALVPNAPFKGDLWLELALKRMLQYAVENGYDAISWARSDQIAKAVGAQPEKLALQYDQKIGKFLDKYTKKWGGKVEEAKGLGSGTEGEGEFHARPNGDNWDIVGWDGHIVEENVPGPISSRLRELNAQGKKTENQILRITPEMRDSIARGQPLFARSDNEGRQHAIRQLSAGRAVDVDPGIVTQNALIVHPIARRLPADIDFGIVSRIEPPAKGEKYYRGTFTRTDGSTFDAPLSDEVINQGRALFSPSRNFIGSLRFGTLGVTSIDQAIKTLGGEVHHEAVHAIWRRLPPSVRSTLASHADTIGVLDVQMRDYLTLIGDPSWKSAKPDEPIREGYLELYKERGDIEDLLAQELVAHMLELYSHGFVSDELAGPVKGLLDAIINDPAALVGEAARKSGPQALLAQRGAEVPVTETPAFKRWFGDSKAVDENGKPLVVYHGTGAEIKAFNPKKRGASSGLADAKEGFFFFADPRGADTYAENADFSMGSKAQPNIIASYLKMENPLIVQGSRMAGNAPIMRKARAEGHDGVIFRNAADGGVISDIYAVFDPTQIKSAIGNRGTFDPNNPDITFAARAKGPDITETFADIRAELGLKLPEGPKKGKPPSLRTQIVAIASEGGRQLLQIYRDSLMPVVAKHRSAIEEMALPLSSDRIGDGMTRFFREFVLRPKDLRARQRALYDDFSDFLDAEAPQLLEAIDEMHRLGRERLMEMRKSVDGIPGTGAPGGAGGGGAVPPAGGGAAAAGAPPPPPGGSMHIPGVPPASKIPFAASFRQFTDAWKRNFQPELISIKALEADPLFASYRAAAAQLKDAIVKQGEELHAYWRKLPERQRLDFIRDLELGADQPTQGLAEIAWRYRQLLDEAHKLEAVYGSKAGYVEDYFPHIWKDAAKAREVFKAMSAAKNLGPKWFEKERFYDLIEEGLKAGLELKSTNPEELIAMRLMAGADMRMRMELLQQLKKMGLARETKGADNTGFATAGWQAINAPNMEQWLISPDVVPLWENAVEAKGLWANEKLPGSIFRTWMAFKSAWVPIKLTASMFHPLHVLHINMANDFARAWVQLTRAGDVRGAAASFLDAFTPTQGIGYDARHAWLKPDTERTPAERAIVQLMIDGGFKPQMDEMLKHKVKQSLQTAIEEGKWLKALPLGAFRLLQKLMLQDRIFENWIPGVKAAAYLKEVQALLDRRPDLLDDNIQRRVAFRAIAKSVDNRFGEMNYSALFWNRTIKDMGIGAFLSLGWNLGFVREFGGGVAQPIARRFTPSSKPRDTIRATTNKTAFVIAYVSSAALINAVMNYLFTGEAPKGYDYIFPRIGGLNPDGSPRRITNMFYTREIPMAMKHIEEQQSLIFGLGEMLYNKMLFQPFVEMAENRDYWGYEIWDTNAPLYKQTEQFAWHILKDQLTPMTSSGAQRAKDIGGSWLDKGVPLSFLGFGPAPAYVERTPLENRIRYLYTKFVAPVKKPYEREAVDDVKREAKQELKLALQRGDQQAAAEARKKAREAGVKSSYLTQRKLNVPSSAYLFSRLPPETQRSLLQNASPEEVQLYRKYANSKLRREFPAQVTLGQGAPAGFQAVH